MSDTLLSVRGVSKSFPGVKALDDVSFEVRPGTVHALCGENGAGKSTLMKIINGIYQPDTGEIRVRGEEVRIRNPIEARAQGIAMIAQELNFVPEMTIAESFFLGRLPMKFGKVDWRHIRREARRILKAEGLDFSINRRLSTLTVSEIQTLEIVRAVYHSADVLIMDEPTSAIAHKEVESLFAKIRALRAEGKSIIYISHKMDEVFELADDISVLRDGAVVSSQRADEITSAQVIAQMVGRDLDHQSYPKERIEIGPTVFRASGLSSRHLFENIDLEIKAGEIVGLAGLIGAGRSEVVRAIFGLDSLDAGTIEVDGKPADMSTPRKAIANGVAMLSEDRRLVGIIPKLSIKKNATLASLRKVIHGGFAHPRKEEKLVEEYFSKMNVKAPSTETRIESLSGGNQQKVLLARWLIADPKVLLLDEPTRGIDVGAKYEIYKIMTELARQGRGILMISSELPELIGMCDRIYVMSGGRLTAELEPPQFSQETILKFAMNEIEVA
ncbi:MULTISPECIES: sugar ABC transporter ATP-binding protein [Microbacterium]|uniref:Sugar ABC transporter ATP-binding protein n=1 Tax=Microbacterium wangchenii TaxID=2541726 RepID=A0ABX5STU8_9MICO|nr:MULTISPECIES: sugar ABC transporter ATP-binding protein [Microbacterium]MCK6067450.1 sugar ABC transporter ATP-binding protein [Microbacterium sp. EYE_512]QBR89613.1 sugar ABC transporter ATP-binding protein [Microbacterium wangchenii]TFV80962.1 sugar ABC transporter ATP-binding protein [Microbacterium sp. dk485]TXK16788.1 sugar ABC transporter ATP-binding protein [Microbacterium wangchenii]